MISTIATKTLSVALRKPFERVGIVVSSGLMTKTIKVRVAKVVEDKRLRIRLNSHTDYLVHDEAAACREGDVVRILAGQRSSKNKRHVVSEIITPYGTEAERKPIESNDDRVKRWLEKRSAKLERRMVKRPWMLTRYGVEKGEFEGVEHTEDGLRGKLAKLLMEGRIK